MKRFALLAACALIAPTPSSAGGDDCGYVIVDGEPMLLDYCNRFNDWAYTYSCDANMTLWFTSYYDGECTNTSWSVDASDYEYDCDAPMNQNCGLGYSAYIGGNFSDNGTSIFLCDFDDYEDDVDDSWTITSIGYAGDICVNYTMYGCNDNKVYAKMYEYENCTGNYMYVNDSTQEDQCAYITGTIYATEIWCEDSGSSDSGGSDSGGSDSGGSDSGGSDSDSGGNNSGSGGSSSDDYTNGTTTSMSPQNAGDAAIKINFSVMTVIGILFMAGYRVLFQ